MKECKKYVSNGALHTELELEYSSQDSSRNEFSRVETRRVERHFFVPTLISGKRLVLQKLGFSRVGTSSEGSDITKIFPKFEKSQFPKLAKTKISEKNV